MSKRNRLAGWIFAVCVAFGLSAARAEELVSDDFSYTGALTDNGWVAYSGADASITANGSVAQIGSGAEDIRLVFADQGADPTYASFTLNVSTLPSSGGEYSWGFSDGTAMESRFGIVSEDSGSAYGVTIYGAGSTVLGTFSGLALNTDYQIAVYFDGVDNHRLWVDPGSGDFATPTLQATAANAGIDGFFIRQAGALDNGAAAWTMGTLVVATTFEDVVSGGGSPTTNVRFTASSAAVGEDAGTYEVTVIKTLPEGNFSGQIALSGTATEGDDYTIDTTNFVMNGATTSATFTITIIDDLDEEADETVILTLANVTGGDVGSPSVFTLTIVDNDTPPEPAEGILAYRFTAAPFLAVSTKEDGIAVSDMALSAGTIETDITTGTYFPNEPYIEETGGWTATDQASAKAFQFTITPDVDAAVTITGISFRIYATAAGPSAIGYDIGGFASAEFNLTNAVLLEVNQPVTGVVGESDPILVKIQGWLNGSRTSSGTGALRLDDVVIHGTVGGGTPSTNVRFSVASASVGEGDGEYVVTVIKSLPEGNISGEITLGGTATEGVDYSINTTSFTMNGATTSATFTITIVDDADVEGNETVILTLVNVVGGTIGSPSVFTLTIVDNDEPPPPPPPAGAIAYYTFTGSTRAPEFVAANANASSVSVSAGSTTFGTAQATTWTGSGIPYLEATQGWTNQTEQSLAKHFLVTVEATSGYVMTITNISMLYRVTAAGPPGIGVAINDTDLAAISTIADTTVVFSVAISGYANIASASIKLQGWDDSSRASTGGGAFRIDDVLVQGFLTPDGGPIIPDEQEIISFTMAGGIPNITLGGSQASVNYQLRYTTDLSAPQTWTPIGMAGPGSGLEMMFMDVDPSDPMRIYQVDAIAP